MRTLPLLAAAVLSVIAAPAIAQDFLGRLVQSTAQSAAQNLANRAVTGATKGRPAKPAAQPAARAAAVPPTTPTQVEAAPQAPAPGAAAPVAASASAGGALVVSNKMPVISSDGVRVAETMHVPGDTRAYGPDEMFFTADTTYRLRRIYAREVTVRGNSVHLKMTAAQYRARNQNPEYYPG